MTMLHCLCSTMSDSTRYNLTAATALRRNWNMHGS